MVISNAVVHSSVLAGVGVVHHCINPPCSPPRTSRAGQTLYVCMCIYLWAGQLITKKYL